MLDASAEECKSLKGTTCNTSQEGLEKLKQCSNESRPGICVGEAAIGPEDVAPVKS